MAIYKKATKKRIGKSLIVAFFLITLCVAYYLANNNNFTSFRGENIEGDSNSILNSEKKVIDCARKIHNEDFLAQGEIESSDCRFMGCGDVF